MKRFLGLRPWKRHSLVLAVLGTVYIAIGWAYVLSDPPSTPRRSSLELALNLMPLNAWGLVWVFVGALGILSSRWPPASETWGYTTMSGLAALWGSFYLAGVLVLDGRSSLTAALVWYMVAFLWWAISGLKNPDDDGLG